MASFFGMQVNRPILFDGAMGTELQKRGLSQDPALLNISAPDDITAIHREYLAAGADILTTNTFGAYRHKYNNAVEIIQAAVSHGLRALNGQKNKWLALDIGPTGLMLEPYGETTAEECFQIFKEAIHTGAACGVDLILVETMMDLTELALAVNAAKETGLPVFATMSFDKNGVTMMGASIKDMVQTLENLGVYALGINCGFGPDVYTELATRLSGISRRPIIVQPNAGMPVVSAPGPGACTSVVRYDLTAEGFAKSMAKIDAEFIGGCCGTSPAHIKALAGYFGVM